LPRPAKVAHFGSVQLIGSPFLGCGGLRPAAWCPASCSLTKKKTPVPPLSLEPVSLLTHTKFSLLVPPARGAKTTCPFFFLLLLPLAVRAKHHLFTPVFPKDIWPSLGYNKVSPLTPRGMKTFINCVGNSLSPPPNRCVPHNPGPPCAVGGRKMSFHLPCRLRGLQFTLLRGPFRRELPRRGVSGDGGVLAL